MSKTKKNIDDYPYKTVDHERYGKCISLTASDGDVSYLTLNDQISEVLRAGTEEEKFEILEPLIASYDLHNKA